MIKLSNSIIRWLKKTQAVETPDYSVREMTMQLLSLSDQQFGAYAFSRDPLERKFSEDEKKAYIEKANLCGRNEALLLKRENAEPSFYVKELNLTVREQTMPAGGGYVIFAQYEEPDQITIFSDCLSRLDEMLREDSLLDLFHIGAPKADSTTEGAELQGGSAGSSYTQKSLVTMFKNILLYHEIFHAIEFQKRETIFTQTERKELWRKPFSNRSKILALSEIAAMAFAKEMTGISFSPYVLDVLLICGYDMKAACALFEEIMGVIKE